MAPVSFTPLPFAPPNPAAIYCRQICAVLLSRQQQALAECRRVLAAGGRLALCFNAKSEMAKWPGHVHGFTLYELAEVEAMLGAAGFGGITTATGKDPQQGLFHCVSAVSAIAA